VREVVGMTADSAEARGSGPGAPDPEAAPARPGRVLEISDDEGSAAWCGQLFVRAGFTVTKAETAGRRPPDRASDLFLNTGKARVAAELGSAELADLAAGHDLVVTDASAADARRHGLLDLPAPVVASITPFGLAGPYADWAATDATLMALGGHTFLSGDIGRAPLTMPGRYPAYQAGNFAFVAAGAALLSGAPARIEVSVLECLATLHQFTDTMWTEDGIVRGRHGNRWANLAPMTLLPAPDGWFMINITPNFWAPFTRMIGREELSAPDHPWSVSENRVRDADEIDQVVLAAIGDWPKERIFREGQGTWRVPFGYVQTMREVLDDPHLAEREFWRPAGGPAGAAGAPVVLPGSPYRFHHADGPAARPAVPAGPAPVTGTAAGQPAAGPLAGIRILDLSHVWAGPLAARLLADLGADVIKVEAPARRAGPLSLADPGEDAAPGLRPWNRQPLNNKLNRNRRGLGVDLKAPAGRDIFLRLAAGADLMIENFSARVLTSLKLTDDVLAQANPRLIHLAMPGFGLSGPYAPYVAYGPSTEPMTGLNALMGYSDEEPRATAAAVLDAMSGTLAAVAAIDALLARQRTGTGGLVELSQHEAGILYYGEYLVRRQLEDQEPHRLGNAEAGCAPSGVYRCAGQDDWIAITARTEDQWRSLAALAAAGWLDDDRFAGLPARIAHRPALDAAVEAFTRSADKAELMAALQAAGVPAGAVRPAPEWLADPHLQARGYYSHLADADRPPRVSDGLPVLINGRRDYGGWRRAPMLGEHNAAILAELGFTAGEIRDLREREVIADRPPGTR
jgi:crotonobetainyl-CoA:carnitine CoA-transferase CaiB-like acyl-CoA transferase